MNSVVELFTDPRREDAIRSVQEIIPVCVRDAAAEVGENAFKSFFDGYKDSVDSTAKAA